jgi:hypothetical protein
MDPSPELDRILTALRPRYRRCYAQGVQTTSEFPSAIDITIDVAGTGRVSRVEVSSRPALPADAIGCIEETTKAVPFPAKDGGPSTIKIPIRFTR